MSRTVDSIQSAEYYNPPHAMDYKPVPPLAPVALFLGICSASALFGFIGLGLCLVGVIVGLVCLLKIRKAQGELGGKRLARIGTGLSVLFLIGGSTLHAYILATEVPDGFRRISFSADISKKGLIFDKSGRRPHPDVAALDGQKIFVKGYMYPLRQSVGLSKFVLVKDNQQCCFGGQPDVKDMISVTMDEKYPVDYYQTLVSVGGIFHSSGSDQNALGAVYELDGLHFEPARTSF